ncbi:saccharopine dehydrogenase family protein [Paenibacillus paridis]|uniref:saccharopine dehydrogenase family protein n=1 Tax=Paenibacillus paridis TaxID=2583376 RepID=UPI00111F0A30|nr:saccharopine dehydrogenase NADP-binding domain-containing protein [Paenibacillus paridis]
MKTDIIVVGGYGHVGGQICEQLAQYFPGKVYAAGRSLARAEQFCSRLDGKVKPLRIAVGEPLDLKQIEKAKLIVMCLDQEDTSFAKACLAAGVDYVDVSANGDFFAAMERLKQQENNLAGTAVLSVGLAPGLTNLLALKAAQSMDVASRVDIAIMLGLGDAHGQAAIEWTVDSLARSFAITERGIAREVNSFTEGSSTDFGFELGERTAYRFPFSDQQTLARTLKIPTVSTRLCFDSRPVTGLLRLLKAVGFGRLLGMKPIRNMTIQSFGKLKLGSARYAVKVTGYGKRGGADVVAEYALQGAREAEITAMTAVGVAKAVYENELPQGIFHVEQLFELDLYEHRLVLRLKGQHSELKGSVIANIQSWSRIQG